MKFSKLSLLVVLCFFFQGSFLLSSAQDAKRSEFAAIFGGDTATFANASYSPTSQHILIGMAEGRKITQAGIGLDHSLKRWSQIKISYEGSIVPLFLESDPVLDGVSSTDTSGKITTTLFPAPFRPIDVSQSGYFSVQNSGGYSLVFGQALYGPRETTYAFAALPVGARVSALPHSPIQPTFTVNLGCLYATRNIPVDYTSSFNFLAYMGPGVEIFWDRKHSVEIEYLYEHLSNADLGLQNPGVDSGTFRLTFSRYR